MLYICYVAYYICHDFYLPCINERICYINELPKIRNT